MPAGPHTRTPHDIRLRPVEAGDLPALYGFQRDTEANELAVVRPRTRADFDAFWARVLADPEVTARTIMARGEVGGEVVGSISCFTMEGCRAVGFWIARAHWGRGIATRALALLLEEVHERPLHAWAASTNAASIRVLQRCGFVTIGTRTAPASDRFPGCEETILRLGP